MNERDKQNFFRVGTPHTVSIGGKKLALANFPQATRNKLMKRLAEKDVVLAKGQLGILPGLLINGKQVTKDNIHEFEKKEVEEKTEKVEKVEKKKAKKEKENI
jgi:hypothetical protein